MNDIVETLAHIEYHFSSLNNIKSDLEPLDVVDIKCDFLDGDVYDAADSYQLDENFIDCYKSVVPKEEEIFENDSVDPVQQTSDMTRENYSDLEGLFEWKCLYCAKVFKKCTKSKAS